MVSIHRPVGYGPNPLPLRTINCIAKVIALFAILWQNHELRRWKRPTIWRFRNTKHAQTVTLKRHQMFFKRLMLIKSGTNSVWKHENSMIMKNNWRYFLQNKKQPSKGRSWFSTHMDPFRPRCVHVAQLIKNVGPFTGKVAFPAPVFAFYFKHEQDATFVMTKWS